MRFYTRPMGGRSTSSTGIWGYGITGRKLSIWLGDKRFNKDFIDCGSEVIGPGLFLLGTDGIIKHPELNVQSLMGRMDADTDLGEIAYRTSQDFAVSGRDNTSFIIVGGSDGSGDCGET